VSISPANSLTVDVEDWYHVCGRSRETAVPQEQWRVRPNVARILELLAACRVRGTFFVLGSLAEALPELVPSIAAAGHEVASHGWSHRLVPELGPAGFRDELRRTSAILTEQSGARPAGYRAPQWSLSAATPWAFQILAEEGYRYDASCSPLPFIGDPAGPRRPFRRPVPGGPTGGLWEIPPLVTPTPLGNLPTGGGWGFRFFPLRFIERTITRLNREGAPAVLFLHPRELDPTGPRLALPPLRRFVTYGSRGDAAPRLRLLLGRRPFTTLIDLVDLWDSAS
jgi:polysaccharide deacetylase family protein (PEP-CTERM system associated)